MTQADTPHPNKGKGKYYHTPTIALMWEIDLLLSTAEGINVPSFARDWGCSEKTVRRILSGLKSFGNGNREIEQINIRSKGDNYHIQRWTKNSSPVFTDNIADNNN